jgi:hypothetical protein
MLERAWIASCTITGLLLCASGCIENADRCGAGEQFVDGVCRAVPDGGAPLDEGPAPDRGQPDRGQSVPGSGVPHTDATARDGLGEGGAADAASPTDGSAISGLGEPCTGHPACTGQADYCAKMPGAASGYCTITGCDPAKDNCPVGYYCLDLSLFAPTEPKICAKR